MLVPPRAVYIAPDSQVYQEFLSLDGTHTPYYFNPVTQESVWELPAGAVSVPVTPSNAAPLHLKRCFLRLPESDWGLVTLGDGSYFYYNKKTQSSIWELPVELEMLDFSVRDIERLVDQLHVHGSSHVIRQRKFSSKHPSYHNTLDSTSEESSLSSSSSGDEEPQVDDVNDGQIIDLNSAGAASSDSDVRLKLSQIKMYQDAGSALNECSDVQKKALFMDFLSKSKVSCIATFVNTINAWIDDPNLEFVHVYHPNMPKDLMKEAFDEYLSQAMKRLKASGDQTKRSAESAFEDLLREHVKGPKTAFSSIIAKCHRDPRYKAIIKAKDRESMFKHFISTQFNQMASLDRNAALATPSSQDIKPAQPPELTHFERKCMQDMKKALALTPTSKPADLLDRYKSTPGYPEYARLDLGKLIAALLDENYEHNRQYKEFKAMQNYLDERTAELALRNRNLNHKVHAFEKKIAAEDAKREIATALETNKRLLADSNTSDAFFLQLQHKKSTLKANLDFNLIFVLSTVEETWIETAFNDAKGALNKDLDKAASAFLKGLKTPLSAIDLDQVDLDNLSGPSLPLRYLDRETRKSYLRTKSLDIQKETNDAFMAMLVSHKELHALIKASPGFSDTDLLRMVNLIKHEKAYLDLEYDPSLRNELFLAYLLKNP